MSPSLRSVGGFLLAATVNSGWAWHSTITPTTPLGRGSRYGSSRGSAVSSPLARGCSSTAMRTSSRCSPKSSRSRQRPPFCHRSWDPPSITVAFASKTEDREEAAVDTAASGTESERAKNVGEEQQLEVGEIYSNPVTALLGRFLPDATAENDVDGGLGEFTDDFDVPKAVGLSIDEMVRRLDMGLREREWFVTGNVCPELFADDFFFKDPDVQLRGIRKYAEGVRTLFDQETSRAEIISCELDQERTESANASSSSDVVRVVSVRWRLSGRVNIGPLGLNIKPYIVTSDLHVRENDGLVVYQEDTFDIPGWDLLLSSFAPWLPFLAPPAPPVSEMMSKTEQ